MDNLVYKTITGLKIASPNSVETKEIVTGSENSSDEDEGSNTDSHSSENEGSKFINSARPKHETAEEKKERKKAIKEKQAEKRKVKIKKHIKKRKEKTSKKK